MTKIGLFGANGRMGRALIEAMYSGQETQLAAATVRADSSLLGSDVGELAGVGQRQLVTTDSLDHAADAIDVVIDFTLPEVLEAHLDWCVAHSKPIVIGTTGLNPQQLSVMHQAAQKIPVVFAANYSVGVNLLLNLARQTARVMGHSADIEIIEAHHRFKVDAPSGTAMALGEAIADTLDRDLTQCAVYGREGHTGQRAQDTIGFATVRGGDVVGDHTVLFADLGERIELTHKASSRLTFAKGALTAAKWIQGQAPGCYDMQDVLGLK